MRNKKIYFILGIFLFSGLMNFIISQTRAYIETYDQRTDPTNPFLFTVDTIYTTSDGSFTTNEVQQFYHQVYLNQDKSYSFYISGGINTEETILWIHSSISTTIDYLRFDSFNEYTVNYLFYICPIQTGWYNITIRSGSEGHLTSIGFGGIGVLEIPIIQLDTEIKSNYWSFKSDPIMLGILELDSEKQYQTGHNGLSHDYSGTYEYSKIYCFAIDLLSRIERLGGSHIEIDFVHSDIITTFDLGGDSGKYLFYSLKGISFSLMEMIEEEEQPPPDFGIIILIIILSIVGIISIVGIYKFKTSKKKSDELISKQIKKVEASRGMKYCSNCGQEIKKGVMFCEFCGKEQ